MQVLKSNGVFLALVFFFFLQKENNVLSKSRQGLHMPRIYAEKLLPAWMTEFAFSLSVNTVLVLRTRVLALHTMLHRQRKSPALWDLCRRISYSKCVLLKSFVKTKLTIKYCIKFFHLQLPHSNLYMKQISNFQQSIFFLPFIFLDLLMTFPVFSNAN